MFEHAKTGLIAGIVGILLGFPAGIWVSALMDAPTVARIESPAEPERHASGALTLERNPEAPRPKPLPRAKNAETVRIVTIQAPASPEPQTIQIDVQRQTDDTERITVATDAGEILGGMDIPTRPKKDQVPRWNIGLYQMGEPGIYAIYGEKTWTFGAMMNLEQEIGLMLGFRF